MPADESLDPNSLRESWEGEEQALFLYHILSQLEEDEAKRKLFERLAVEAEGQSRIWAERSRGAGHALPEAYQPTLRLRLVAVLLRRLGTRPILPVLAAMKVRGLSVYRGSSIAVTGHPMPTSLGEEGHRHRGVEHGGTLRAAVFGVNDGLVSNASLIMGVAGASPEPGVVVLSGVAGLLAGAFSMAAGEYISVRSQRELFEHQIALEEEELQLYPEEEAEELALIFNARGLPLEEARRLGSQLIQDPEKALDTLAREELGLNPDELGSPWRAAVSSFLSFAVGALVPLMPFLSGGGSRAVLWSAVSALTGLFCVGSALSLFTGLGAVWSGLRMVVIGLVAGLATFTIGSLLGVSLL